MMLDLVGVEGSERGIRFYGEVVEKERLIGFDLTKPVVT